MNMDKLFESVKTKGHVCVGLDTAADYVPDLERKKAQNDAEAVLAFNIALIDAVCDVCACFKVQIAYYEEMGLAGLRAYSETLKYIRQKNCLAIADIKRSDIADTALRYAKAHFSGDFEADFVTLSPYMGMDSLDPWLDEARKSGKGAFVLMRTSNKGMRDFQYLKVDSEQKKPDKKRLYNVVGEKMSASANQHMGNSGYGMFGVVVGCTEKDEAAAIREKYSNLFFLIPGYGAQGGGAKDVALLLREKNGGVVNASRSIITAWISNNFDLQSEKKITNLAAAQAARSAAVKMRDEILGELS